MVFKNFFTFLLVFLLVRSYIKHEKERRFYVRHFIRRLMAQTYAYLKVSKCEKASSRLLYVHACHMLQGITKIRF